MGLTTLDILGYPIDTLPKESEGALIAGIDVVPAGTAGGFALVAAVLGLRTGLISALGDDRMGRFVRIVMAEHGVDMSLVPNLPGLPTSATILPIDSHGQRPTLHAVGASMLTEITEQAVAAAAQARFIHWGAIGGARIDPAHRDRFLSAGRRSGATITCDLIAPRGDAAREVAAILPAVDLFMPSLVEARVLTAHDDPELAAAALLALGVPTCVIKLGAAGVLIAQAGAVRRVPAFDVAVVDTTSCGDALCAGTVAGLSHGLALDESVRLGAATAALVAQGLGTLGKLTGLAQAQVAAATLVPRA